MLIRIGDALVDPSEIVAVRDLFEPVDVKPTLAVWLRNGETFDVEATMDEAEAALIDAGVIEDPEADAGRPLTDIERSTLQELDEVGYEWMARDGDGKLYAFMSKPKKEGAYWDVDADRDELKPQRIETGFDFIDAADEDPWQVACLLAE